MNRFLAKHMAQMEAPEAPVTWRFGMDPVGLLREGQVCNVDMAMKHLAALKAITRKRRVVWPCQNLP